MRLFLFFMLFSSALGWDAKAQVTSLDQALVLAYQNNPSLQAQREALKVVDEQMAQAISGYRPTITGNWEKGRYESRFGTNPSASADTETQALQVRQPLFSGLETVYSVSAAEANIQAQRQALKDAEQNTLLDTATAFADVIRTRKLVDLGLKNEEVLRSHLKASNDRFRVGEVTRTDVAQSESRLATATSQRVQAEANAASAEATFERIVGQKMAREAVADMVQLSLPETLAAAIELAQKENPSLRQRQFNRDAAEETIGVQRSQLLPKVDLVGTMQRQNDLATSFGTIDTRNDSLVVGVSIPLYESGSSWSRTRAARKELEKTKFDAMDVGNRVQESVVKAWEDWQAARATNTSNQTAIDAAKTALVGATQEYLYGTRTTLDVLDAEQELFQAQVNLVTSQRNEVVAQCNLAVLVGNFTAAGLKLPVEIYDPQVHYDNNKYKILGY
jgi:outer membrane protein